MFKQVFPRLTLPQLMRSSGSCGHQAIERTPLKHIKIISRDDQSEVKTNEQEFLPVLVMSTRYREYNHRINLELYL